MMKRAIVVFIIMLMIFVPKVFSQVISYDIEVSYNNNQLPVTADITVKITKGVPDFTYFLTTNDPLNGTVLQQSETVKQRSYVFRDVKPGKYFLKIQDSTGIQTGKTVNVIEKPM